MSAETIPDKEFLKKVLNHDFRTLIGLAGLLTALQEAQDKDPAFAANWAIASEWSPDARYETKDSMLAQVFLNAMSDPQSGVFQWIKRYW